MEQHRRGVPDRWFFAASHGPSISRPISCLWWGIAGGWCLPIHTSTCRLAQLVITSLFRPVLLLYYRGQLDVSLRCIFGKARLLHT